MLKLAFNLPAVKYYGSSVLSVGMNIAKGKQQSLSTENSQNCGSQKLFVL